jgi:hypothetical protein
MSATPKTRPDRPGLQKRTTHAERLLVHTPEAKHLIMKTSRILLVATVAWVLGVAIAVSAKDNHLEHPMTTAAQLPFEGALPPFDGATT